MKKFYAFTILITFLFNQISYYYVADRARLELENTQRHLFSSLQDEDCEMISFNDNAKKITWQQFGTDFLLDGEEYDVVRIAYSGERVTFYCITDKKESKLLQSVLDNQSSNQNNKTDYAVIYLDEFISNPVSELVGRKQPRAKNHIHTYILPDNIREIILPPPRPVNC